MKKYPERLYEDNPNKGNPLRINRLKSNVSLKLLWQDLNGKWHNDWFIPNTEHYKANYSNMMDFHLCNFPEDGLRDFLQHVPLHNMQVEVWRED